MIAPIAFLPVLAAVWVQRIVAQDVPASQPDIGELKGNWEAIDQRFVFLTIELSSTEKSIAAINKALVVAGYQQARFQERAQNYRQDSDRMDRNGGGPVAWQDFYGKTAAAFFYHPSASVDIQAQGNNRTLQAHGEWKGEEQAITRPPQMDYIYRANANGEKRADTDAAQIGNKIDDLLQHRRELEAEQSALWCKIAFRALSTRELSDKPRYRFEMTSNASDEPGKEQLAVVAACCKFMRAINLLSEQLQPDIDSDQGEALAGLQQGVAGARRQLKTVLLQQGSLETELEDPSSSLGQFDKAAKRLEDSSQNLADAYRLAAQGDRAGDDNRKQNFRAQLQQEAFDFVETIVTEDECLKTLVGNWKITPDVSRPVAIPIAPAGNVSSAPPVAPHRGGSDSSDAAKTVDDLYKDEIAAAVTPQQQSDLAIKLLQVAKDTKDDPAGRTALLTKARDLAAQAGDLITAYQAIDQQQKTDAIDALQLKLDAASTVVHLASAPATLTDLVGEVNGLVDATIAADRYDIAVQAADLAVWMAQRTNDSSLMLVAASRASDARACADAFEKVKPFAASLASTPTDPQANLAVGRFRCFFKGDWDRGLALLALGNDDTLKAVATEDIDGATSAVEQVKLGDAWWELAQQQSGTPQRNICRRAGKWYTQALPGLHGLAEVKVTKRLKEISAAVPSLAAPSLSGATPEVNVKSPDLFHSAKWFRIINRANGGDLWVTYGNMNPGNGVGARAFEGSDNQIWALEPVIGFDGFRIANKYSQRYIGVRGEGREPGVDIIEWIPRFPEGKPIPAGSPSGINWRFEPVGDGFKIVNQVSGLCLTYLPNVSDSMNQQPWNASAAQIWNVVPANVTR